VPYTFAETVYQQFSDSSGEVKGISGCIEVGTFTVSRAINIASAEIQYVARNNSGISGTNIFNIGVSTSSPSSSCLNTGLVVFPSTRNDGSYMQSNNVGEFMLGTSTTLTTHANNLGYTTYLPGVTYHVLVDSGTTNFYITMNLSNDFYYGYLTAGGFPVSLPVLPGIPGYTDYGISTTSQQVYCYGNFSTSSGLLDNVGQSLSLGICNVAVFLFIPSNTALAQFSSLASTTQSRAPFSYFFDLYNAFNSLVASSSTNVPTYTAGLGSLGIGATSSIGNILPNLTLLSTSTINQYLPAGIYDALMLLARSSLWVALGFVLYRIGKKEFSPHPTT